jgi:hypothetical protein
LPNPVASIRRLPFSGRVPPTDSVLVTPRFNMKN